MPPEEQCEDWSSPARYWRPSSPPRSAWPRLDSRAIPAVADQFRARDGGARVPARRPGRRRLDRRLHRRDGRLRDRRGRGGLRPRNAPGLRRAARARSTYLATASDGAAADAAKTGKAILAVVAAGGDPASFQGRDLIGPARRPFIDPATGAYGDGSTFSQSFAVLAVVASGRHRASGGHGRAGRRCRIPTAAGATAPRPGRRRHRRHELDGDRAHGPRRRPAPLRRRGGPCLPAHAAARRRRLPVLRTRRPTGPPAAIPTPIRSSSRRSSRPARTRRRRPGRRRATTC